jgi:hypothetical protein
MVFDAPFLADEPTFSAQASHSALSTERCIADDAAKS